MTDLSSILHPLFRYVLIFSLILISSPLKTWSLETNVKGFVALDLLNWEKIEGRKGKAVIGIGVLDLKIFAEHDAMTFNMKLDLDGNLSEENNIFEEAYVGYKGIRDFRFMAGKGVARFQTLHWGVIENTYQDGGTVLGAEHSFYKLSKRAFVSIAYGHYSRGFLNTFTFFGNSKEVKTDEDGVPYYDSTSSGNNVFVKGYTYESVTAFDTDKQMGLANRLELYPTESLKLANGFVVMRNKFTEKSTVGGTVSLGLETSALEFWASFLYGYTSTAPYERFSTYGKKESILQLGGEIFLNEDWSFLANAEGMIVDDRAHTYPSFIYKGKTYQKSNDIRKHSTTIKTTQYKLESGIKYKLNKSAFMTLGGLYERKIVEKDGTPNLLSIDGVFSPNRQAFKGALTLSYWF